MRGRRSVTSPKLRLSESRQDRVCQAFVWSQELAALDRPTAVGVKDGPDCLHGAAHLGHLIREAIRVEISVAISGTQGASRRATLA